MMLQTEAGARLEVRISKRHSCGRITHFKLDTGFIVPAGVTVLLGHSGAGKTTILRCIAGLCDPDAGVIALGERVLFDSSRKIAVEPARRRIAFVFQDLALFPHLTVQDNVGYGLRRLGRTERDRRIGQIIESFQIAHLRHRLPSQISGGECQRVALARSLVTEPDALLLDEPFCSLDASTKATIIADLRKWNDLHRIPILHVTHDHSEVFAFGERVMAMEQGRIVTQGLPLEVVPPPSRAALAQSDGFENLVPATVIERKDQKATMICRLEGTAAQFEVPLTRVEIGSKVRIGIRASDCHLVHSERKSLVRRLFVFVCGGNTSRSPIAEAICNSEIARRLGVELALLERAGILAVSAGLTAQTGTPMTKESKLALEALGVPAGEHSARNLNFELADQAEAIFCMTRAQRTTIVTMFPFAEAKTHCLKPEVDIADPHDGTPDMLAGIAREIQSLIPYQLDRLGLAAA